MEKPEVYDSWRGINDANLNALLRATNDVTSKRKDPIYYLEQTAGPFSKSQLVAEYFRKLTEQGKKTKKVVLQDISPSILKIGDRNFRGYLGSDLATNLGIECVLADSLDLKRELSEVPVYSIGEGKSLVVPTPLEYVLVDPNFKFLSSGYKGWDRKEKFSDKTFDIVSGECPYSSISAQEEKISKAAQETARVLRPGGYSFIAEKQVEKINDNAKRTLLARQEAKVPIIDVAGRELDKHLKNIVVLSTPQFVFQTNERGNPNQVIQNGDTVRYSVMVHKKV